MKINFVSREKVKASRKSASKYRPLVDALAQLKPGGQAIEVNFNNIKELNSMRNVVYTFNRENDMKIKSGKDAFNKRIFFFREK